ncbi:MAG TPA: DeoR/GlpR family DNA-binding transcription regulator [Candidatus Blautia faecipullorum]|nr:DeoR/GlpR family DNA-binding transcription regulator [Candidatus Blautia faecipullorum]
MSKDTRRKQILEILEKSKDVTSVALSEHFHVTEETIRKDLNYLSGAGLVIRTFGGAMLKESGEKSLEQRSVCNYAQKQKIAREAAKLIYSQDLIVMDAGSTTSVLANHIADNSEVIVITNSLEIMNILSKREGITLISTGGTLGKKSMSFRGRTAEKTIHSYNLQKAFISCAALDLNKGIMDTSEAETNVKKSMIEEAKEIYLLADSSKFNGIAHVTVCGLDKITAVITDDAIEEDVLQKFRRAGVRVIVAS